MNEVERIAFCRYMKQQCVSAFLPFRYPTTRNTLSLSLSLLPPVQFRSTRG